MKKPQKTINMILLFLISGVLNPQYSFSDPKFTMTEIPNNGWHSIFVEGINDYGQVVGTLAESKISTDNRTIFIWDKENGIQDIGNLLPYKNSFGEDINNSGQIVGYEWDKYPYEEHAFKYSGDSGLIELGTWIDTSWARSKPEKINNYGLVAGWATIGPRSSDYHAFAWTDADGLRDITPELPPVTIAKDCNDSGSVVGTLTTDTYYNHESLFIWHDFNCIQVLGQVDGYDTLGYAINNHNQAVGCLYDKGWTFIPFLWDVDGSLTFLGTLEPVYMSNHTLPLAINDRSQVVGFSITKYDCIAFLWEKGEIYDLNSLITNWDEVTSGHSSDLLLTKAVDINEKGQIIAQGEYSRVGRIYSFLLNPVLQISSKIYPRRLNLNSHGRWVLASVKFPSGYDPQEVEFESIALIKINGISLAEPLYAIDRPRVKTHKYNCPFDLLIKFDRQELITLIEPGKSELLITGKFIDGITFEATGTITGIQNPKSKKRRFLNRVRHSAAQEMN